MKTENIAGIDLIIPQNEQELIELIKPIAEGYGEVLTDDTVIEGNSDKTYGQLKELCILTDWNVALEKEEVDNASHIATVYIQKIDIPSLMQNKKGSGFLWIEGADEISLEPQGLRCWFD